MARALGDPFRLDILALLLAGPATVAEIVAATGSTQPNVSNHFAILRKPAPSSPMAEARSCYDHMAGRLGVGVLEALIRPGALGAPGPDGIVDLGPAAAQVFQALDVDTAAAARARRRFAFACLDWTERRAHLGGALGAALLDRLLQAGWVARQPGTRALLVAGSGRRQLRRILGISEW